MDAEASAKLEAELRRMFDAGDLSGVTSKALEAYGPELYGFLLSMMRTDVDAADAFGELCHQLWRDLPKFRWESSFRTWIYRLARHRCIDQHRDPARRADRRIPLSRSPEVDELVARARTTTA